MQTDGFNKSIYIPLTTLQFTAGLYLKVYKIIYKINSLFLMDFYFQNPTVLLYSTL